MSGDNTITVWLAALAVIATMMNAVAIFFAPALQEVIKAVLNQPTPTPSEKKPKNLTHTKGGWLKVLWPQYLAILGNLALLAWLVYDDAPPTRMSVLAISATVGGTLLVLLNLSLTMQLAKLADFMLVLSAHLGEVSGRTVKLSEHMQAQGERTVEAFNSVASAIEAVAEETLRKPEGLRDTLRRLLGG